MFMVIKNVMLYKNLSSILFAIISLVLAVLLWHIEKETEVSVMVPIIIGTATILICALIIPHYISLWCQVTELKKNIEVGLPLVVKIEHANEFPEFDRKRNEIIRIVTKPTATPIFREHLEISVIVKPKASAAQVLFSYGYVEHIQSNHEKLIQFIIKPDDKQMGITGTMLEYLNAVKKSDILIYAGKWRKI